MQPQQAPLPQPHEYEFIVNPGAPPKRTLLSLPGGSLPKRLLIACGALFGLIILIIIIKGLFGGSTNFAPFTPVVQDQQELIHLSTNATQQTNLDLANQNSAATVLLAVTSGQTQLGIYLKDNHQKVSAKVLNAKVSSSLDSQLTTAISNNSYDATFQQIMQNQLDSYSQALSQAYKTAGPVGKKLLNSDYNSAQLLLRQLNSPAS